MNGYHVTVTGILNDADLATINKYLTGLAKTYYLGGGSWLVLHNGEILPELQPYEFTVYNHRSLDEIAELLTANESVINQLEEAKKLIVDLEEFKAEAIVRLTASQ